MSKASLDFINSGKCYPSEVLNYVLELEQQITELKESQKQKQIIRLCQRLDKAEQQNKELRELLNYAMVILMNHEQSYDEDWIKDYQSCCQIYEQIIT